MKKIILALALVCSTSVMVAVNSYKSVEESQEIYLASASQAREITVYLIKQVGGDAWSKAAYTALYDSDRNVIKVGRFEYTVHENRAYGQERDGRSEYKYVAGGYYFNL